ncbi:zinc finger protein 14-like [Cydia splendana]|uniref:zinc finger protein 14-like n=1 Tax=Cydia splendana TaxID=1100963 RepID=UPI00300D8A7D
MDVMHACRCCLRRAPDKDLTTPYTHLGMTEIYADMIKGCFDINLVVGGSGSCGICSACVGRLRDASHFKLQVEHSQAELQAWIQAASVKVEERAVKSEVSDAASDEDCVSVCSEGSDARAREQLAMDCFVVLERLPSDAIFHSGVETYDCERCCGKHLRNKHILRKRIQKRCSRKATLRLHQRKHTGEKPYKCSHCDYKCSDRTTIRNHERRHTGEKPFTCSYCDVITNAAEKHAYQNT